MAYTYIIKTYADLVRKGKKTLGAIPVEKNGQPIRSEVEKELKREGN